LRIEVNSKEIVFVVCNSMSSIEATTLASKVIEKTIREGKHRVLIYVVSPLGRPKYFEVIRTVLQENISLSISIRYSGAKPEDLLELIRRLNKPDVFMVGPCRNFVQALNSKGYKNIIII